MNYKFGGTFILLLAGSLVLTIVFGSWYTVDQTQRGVLLRNGALVEVVQPGLHFKWPWIESVSKIDMQTHNFTFEKVNSYSAHQQPADLRISVRHQGQGRSARGQSEPGGADPGRALERRVADHAGAGLGGAVPQRALTRKQRGYARARESRSV